MVAVAVGDEGDVGRGQLLVAEERAEGLLVDVEGAAGAGVEDEGLAGGGAVNGRTGLRRRRACLPGPGRGLGGKLGERYEGGGRGPCRA